MLAISLFLIIGTLIIGLIHAVIYKAVVVAFAVSSSVWLLALRIVFAILTVSFVLALFLVVFSIKFPFALTPGGLVRGAQTFLLIAVAAYCAHRTAQGQAGR